MKKAKIIPDENVKFSQDAHVVFMEIKLDEELRNASVLKIKYDDVRLLLNQQSAKDLSAVKPRSL